MVLAKSYTISRRFKTKTLVPQFLVLSTLFAMCDMPIFSCYVMQINLIFLFFFSTGVLSQLILIIIGTGSKRPKWLCNQRNSLAMRGRFYQKHVCQMLGPHICSVFPTPFNSYGSLSFPQHSFRLSNQALTSTIVLLFRGIFASDPWHDLSAGIHFISVCAYLAGFSLAVSPLSLDPWLWCVLFSP